MTSLTPPPSAAFRWTTAPSGRAELAADIQGLDVVRGLVDSGQFSAAIDAGNRLARVNAFAGDIWQSAASGLASWRRFCEVVEANFTLDGLAQEQISNLICDYNSFECGLRGLAPDSIKGVYLPGVLPLLIYNRVASAPMFRLACTDDSVTMTYRGFTRLYNLIHPAADRLKLAFTGSTANHSCELLLRGKISYGAASNLPARGLWGFLRIYCALLFGIMFLQRRSGFLVKQGKPFPPSRASLFFLDIDRNIIADAQVGVVRAEFLTFRVDQSKLDQQGLGRVNTHQR